MQNFSMKSTSRTLTVRVRNETHEKPKKSMLPLLNTVLAKKRNESIKENINKLIAIGTTEIDEFKELMTEFDVAHKKALNIASKLEKVDSDEENIFLDKQNTRIDQ